MLLLSAGDSELNPGPSGANRKYKLSEEKFARNNFKR